MKKIFTYLFAATVAISFTGCSEDDLSNTSIIAEPPATTNAFDDWLRSNYVSPYNINLLYRMKDIEADYKYTLVPADYNKSLQMAKLIKHLCLEAYDEVMGVDFMRNNFPKIIHFIGSPEYNTNGTITLGVAEGGLKITITRINALDVTVGVDELTEMYFHTIHHEFAHILHQKKPFSADYVNITGTEYLLDDCFNRSLPNALAAGFVSQYAGKNEYEDFVEMYSFYVTHSQEWWDARLASAGTAGAALISEKLEMVRDYMQNSWNLDIDAMRTVILRRGTELDQLGL